MYELAAQDDCTPDPAYDPTMCGFSDGPDCKPLDGCGSPVAFIYLYSFTLLVSFILLNIFIAVILEGFANEKDRADGILLPQHVSAHGLQHDNDQHANFYDIRSMRILLLRGRYLTLKQRGSSTGTSFQASLKPWTRRWVLTGRGDRPRKK